MKKVLLWVLAGAAAFATLSCQKEIGLDDQAGKTKEVTTQFVLNVASAPNTKMSADAVQMNNNFRGMDNAKVIAYKTGTDSGDPYVLSTAAPAAGDVKLYDLNRLYTETSVNNSGSNNQDNSSNRVLQLTIPVGVDAFMVYGKAIKENNAQSSAYGLTTGSISTTPGETKFKVGRILDDTNTVYYDHTGALMIYFINTLMRMKVSAVPTTEWPGVTELPELKWSDLGHKYEINKLGAASRYDVADYPNGTALSGLEEILGKVYYTFTYIRPAESPVRPNGEYRAGSSTAIKAMVKDMYKVISTVNNATSTNPEEANAKRLADAILQTADTYFVPAYNSENQPNANAGDYQPIATLQTRLTGGDSPVMTTEQWNTRFGGAKDLNNYPYEDFGVPEGAAQLVFHVGGATETINGQTVNTPDDEFFYAHPNKPLVNPEMGTFEPRKYLYPAELWYYVNSPIRVTNKTDLMVGDYPNGVSNWNAAVWPDWETPGKVKSDTRGVAVKNSINYGVALLKSSVKYYSDSGTLNDNRNTMTNGAELNRSFAVSAAQLEWRGILIGGVNPRYNWQFTRYYTTTTAGDHEPGLGDLSVFDGVIYDHALSSNAISTSTVTNSNYTLVYDNYNSEDAGYTVEEIAANQAKQNDVYVALEFVNNGDAFWGRDNLIPNGGVFYLVAKLPKPAAQVDSFWPTDHQIPPVYGVDGETVPSGKAAGTSKKVARVFIQDYMTTATFTIDQNSLQKAYYSVPDLRSAQMSLGLSVDLSWTPGLNYEIPL